MSKWRKCQLAVILLLMFSAGALFMWWAAHRADRMMRQDLLKQAELIAKGVDLDRVKALTGTEADLNLPDYLYLKESLARVKEANDKCRYIYMMRRNAEGEIIITFDAQRDYDLEDPPATPGEIYEDASDELKAIFDTAEPFTEGPLPDKWGTWISALVPLIDPETGELVAVLGVDIDASVWNWQVAAETALPASSMLIMLTLLSIGVIAMMLRKKKASVKPVQRSLLIPLAAVLLLLVGGFGAIMVVMNQRDINRSSMEKLESASTDLKKNLRKEAGTLFAIQNVLLRDETLVDAIKSKDRKRILANYKDTFEQLKSKHGITHFSFYLPDRVNLLRLHNPEKFGDTIDRFTLTQAQETGKEASGLEVGTNGELTLRAVRPIFDGNTIIAYMELGEEIDDILQSISGELNLELAVVIYKKDILVQEDWENYTKSKGLDIQWNLMPKAAVTYSTLPRFQEECKSVVSDPDTDEEDMELYHTADIKFDGRSWRVIRFSIYDASGTAVGDLVTMRDISDLKRSFDRILIFAAGGVLVILTALFGFLYVLLRRTDRGIRLQQAELAESEERLNLAMAVANDGIWDWHLADNIVYFDTRYYTMAGYKPNEFPCALEEWQKRVHPEDLERANDGMAKFLAGESKAYDTEFRFLRSDGDYMWIRSKGDIVERDEKGTPTRFVGTHSDITDRKQAEMDLLEINRQLEKATIRANEMANRAEKASAAKSEFLANMSHEIRTPMNGIIGMAGLLGETNLTDEQKQYVDTVHICSDQLLTLINDILDFSKVEAGKMELEDLDFDLMAAVEEVTDILASKASEKGLELTAYVSPEIPPKLRGDPGRLKQVLVNLTNNAVKFTPTGEVGIHAKLLSEDEDSVTVRFSVFDTGIGIPENRRDRLFQLFSQVDSSTTRKYGGTGLGLAISKRLVEMMGGQIDVESEEGKGTTFWFTMVFRKQTGAVESKPALQSIDGKRVLVVDDNETNRFLLRKYLESWNCYCETASSAVEALEAMELACERRKPFEIAILDRLMPDVDGEELGRMIKSSPDFRDTHLMMLTSAGQYDNIRRLKEIGFAQCVCKPIHKSQLYNCLLQILDAKHATEAQPEVTEVSEERIHSLPEGLRVLLAEDNIINQKVALQIIEKKLHLRADAVANGLEVIDALREIDYDIVLMDCQMPEMDGYEATRQIRSGKSGVKRADVPIIAMTANAMKGDREVCLEAGMDDYVAKPVRPEALVDVFLRVLEAKAAAAAAT